MTPELALACLVFFGSFAIAMLTTRARRLQIQGLIRTLGLEPTGTGSVGEGFRQGVRVRVRYFTLKKNNGEEAASSRIEAFGVSPNVGLGAQGLGQRLLKELGAQDIEIGDPRFDESVVVRGHEGSARALLSYEARQDVRYLVNAHAAEVVNGWVRFQVQGHLSGTYGQAMLDRAVRVVQQLAPERQGRERLVEQVRADLHGQVRQRCLLELWERGPRELLQQAMASAPLDEDERVSGTAALIQGDGPKILAQHIEVIDAAVAVAPQRACRALGEAGHEDALIRLLQNSRPAVKVAAARGLSRAGTRRSVEVLLPLTEGLANDPELKSAARSALNTIQARVQGSATAGSVSLVEAGPAAGAVSLSQQGGALSLAARRAAEP